MTKLVILLTSAHRLKCMSVEILCSVFARLHWRRLSHHLLTSFPISYVWTDLYRHERALIADQDQDVWLRRSDLWLSFSQMNLIALANVAD